MTSTNYIPNSDTDFLQWVENFAVFVQTEGGNLGLTGPQVADFVGLKITFDTDLTAHFTAQLAAKQATQVKKASRKDVQDRARELAQFFQANPSMTDAMRAQAGLTIPDTQPTESDPGAIMVIPPPLLKLDWSMRKLVIIHWGPNPENEQSNGKPDGVFGVKIWHAIGGIPAQESDWLELTDDTASPFEHSMPGISTATTVAYRAQYLDTKMRKGTFSDPAVCTVTP